MVQLRNNLDLNHKPKLFILLLVVPWRFYFHITYHCAKMIATLSSLLTLITLYANNAILERTVNLTTLAIICLVVSLNAL